MTDLSHLPPVGPGERVFLFGTLTLHADGRVGYDVTEARVEPEPPEVPCPFCGMEREGEVNGHRVFRFPVSIVDFWGCPNVGPDWRFDPIEAR